MLKKKFKQLTIEERQFTLNNSTQTVQNTFGIGKRTVSYWRRKIKNSGLSKNIILDKNLLDKNTPDYDVVKPDKKKIHKLTEDIKFLKKALNDAKKEVSIKDEIKSLITNINNIGISDKTNLDILDFLDKDVLKKDFIVPVFCLSDTHIGSVIDFKDLDGLNEYNTDIAEERIIKLTNTFIKMYCKHLNYSYNGCVVIFGGDMIEQAMHGTEETNDLTVPNQVIRVTEILIKVLKMLKLAFGKVITFAVSGNHGRLIADKYVKNTHRLDNSLEKIVYHYIDSYFKDTKEIEIITAPGDILYFSINGLKFRLEHGDAIRSTGTAIAGPLNSWERARLKRASLDSSTGKPFDVLIFGHFHQHMINDSKMICMNSTKGYDSYVKSMALPFSLPGSTVFAVNNRGELIYATNLKCRDTKTRKHIGKSVDVF